MIDRSRKEAMHPRNRFRSGYDFKQLAARSREFAAFVRPNTYGDLSIDYANPEAVKALNRTLLEDVYGIKGWDIPPGYLCPPVPGRSDYLHYLADLIKVGRTIPRGRSVAVLDVGAGASCIYPLIGASEYGWRFVGTETDPLALRSASKVVANNSQVAGLIECRLQSSPKNYFHGAIQAGEFFDATMCNPPFYASAAEATTVSSRKRRNLGGPGAAKDPLNFGGRASELWCPGGELGFVRRMAEQSVEFARQCRWFTTLVSRREHLPRLQEALRAMKPIKVQTIEMAQGQKRSRILAWTFLEPGVRA